MVISSWFQGVFLNILSEHMKAFALQKQKNNVDISKDPSSQKSVSCPAEGGNSDANFGLSLDGELKVLRDLDREEIPAYSIIIKASSNRSWTPPKGQRSLRAKALNPALDPSFLEVRIELEDINDQTPRFAKAEYTAGNRCCCWLVNHRLV